MEEAFGNIPVILRAKDQWISTSSAPGSALYVVLDSTEAPQRFSWGGLKGLTRIVIKAKDDQGH